MGRRRRRKMESSVKRRLESLSRHLSLQLHPHLHLYPNLLKGGQREEDVANPVVIGGMVLDIHATPSMSPSPRTTTPGNVHYILGGVARNIAECMSKLGTNPYMISAVGLDMAGNLLMEHWNSAGLPTKGILKRQDIKTAVICNIFDTDGELAAAVASVEAIEKFLTPEWIRQSSYAICSSPILMVDANLNAAALMASSQVASETNIPVWFEPVSVAKSKRITSIVKYVTIASPNEDELISMANALSCGNTFFPIEMDNSKSMASLLQMLKPAILVLLEKGVKIVILTLGVNGVFLCSRGPSFMRFNLERTKRSGFNRCLHDIVVSGCPSSRLSLFVPIESQSNLFVVHFPSLPASVVKLTGAGDCLVGGTLTALCSGLDITQSVAVGIAAAKAAVEAETNVPSAFNLVSIGDDARLICSAAKVLSH